MALSECMTRQITEVLDHERWVGYVSGKIEGAMNVLYAMELDKEERLRLLAKAAGLSRGTASSYIEPREVEERILRMTSLDKEEKESLLKLMTNEAMHDSKEMDHPEETLRLMVSIDGNKILEACLPQVSLWVNGGEAVSLNKIRNWLIEKYDL